MYLSFQGLQKVTDSVIKHFLSPIRKDQLGQESFDFVKYGEVSKNHNIIFDHFYYNLHVNRVEFCSPTFPQGAVHQQPPTNRQRNMLCVDLVLVHRYVTPLGHDYTEWATTTRSVFS